MHQPKIAAENTLETGAFQGNPPLSGETEGLGQRFSELLPAFITYARYELSLSAQTAASIMLRNGCDIRYIQKILGHSDIKTTVKYYIRVDKAAVKAVHKKFLKF